MSIERVHGLSAETFVADYLAANRPVIASGALEGTDLAAWTPDRLRRQFGSSMVQVYDDGFDLTDLLPLEAYMDEHLGRDEPADPVPYVRWYTKLREVDFAWADDEFEILAKSWRLPDFVPRSGYLLPFCPPPGALDPTRDRFPARGLFVSGKGARTRLHADPWASDALLVQLCGDKEWLLYPPDQAPLLERGGSCVDPDRPDLSAYPDSAGARPSHRFTLGPGEILFVPRGWYHHVRTLSDSISLTWNFVHAASAGPFLRYLEAGPDERDLEVLRFFFAPHLPDGAGADEMAALVRSVA